MQEGIRGAYDLVMNSCGAIVFWVPYALKWMLVYTRTMHMRKVPGHVRRSQSLTWQGMHGFYIDAAEKHMRLDVAPCCALLHETIHSEAQAAF